MWRFPIPSDNSKEIPISDLGGKLTIIDSEMEANLHENQWEQVLELIKIGSPILFRVLSNSNQS